MSFVINDTYNIIPRRISNVEISFTQTHTQTHRQTDNLIFFPLWIVFSLWCKPPRKVSYKCTFGVPDQGQRLDVWESQTSESALRWLTRHIAPRHIIELTLEVILEVILEHVLGIKIMTSLILDHVARAYLYLGISTGEEVMILLLRHSLGVVTGQNKT